MSRSKPWAAEVAAVAAVVFLCLASTAWMRPLLLPDEGRYVGGAWEMLRSGDWLTPTLNGLPYFHKPPLFYWITASSLAVFGMNEGAARAAPLLGAWMGAISLYLFMRRWCDERSARVALIVLLVQPLFLLGAQFANLDMLVAGLITATVFSAAHAVRLSMQAQPCRTWLAVAYLLAALAVLAKGLIGLVIPVLVLGTWLALLRQWPLMRRLVWGPGCGIFVAAAAPWFIVMQMKHPGFLDYFFVVQHFRRYASSGFNNVQPFWFFPALLLLCHAPWLPWLREPFRLAYFSDAQRGGLRVLAVAWLVMVVVFFSVPRSKLIGYVLPALAPLALLVSDAIHSASARGKGARAWQVGAALLVALSLAVVAALTFKPRNSTRGIGQTLAQLHQAGQPVVMLNNYWFDVPYYGRLREPVVVADAWSSAEVAQRDNWRKELADAGNFKPALARQVLLERAGLQMLTCPAWTTWIVASSNTPELLAHSGATVAVVEGNNTLWRLNGIVAPAPNSLVCPQKPNAD